MTGLATVTHTLASAVAASGSFTVNYGAGTNAGSFRGGKIGRHSIASRQNALMVSPTDFTIAFNTSNMSITLSSSISLPADALLYLNLDRAGSEDGMGLNVENASKLTPILVNFGEPDVADTNGIMAAVTATNSAKTYTSSNFASTFDGTMDVPRNVTCVGTAGSNHVVTVIGRDIHGNVMEENFTLSGTTAQVGDKAFNTVTNVNVATGAASDTLDVGWGDKLGFPMFIGEEAEILLEMEDTNVLDANDDNIFMQFIIGQVDLLAGTSQEIVSPIAGTILGMQTVVQIGNNTTGVITVEIAGTPVTGLSISVAGSATKGTVQNDTGTGAAATVAKGDRIEIQPASEFATAGAVNGWIEIEPTVRSNGAVVVGDQNAATALTGDVRGTYVPNNVPDGALEFQVVVLVADPDYIGIPQFTS